MTALLLAAMALAQESPEPSVAEPSVAEPSVAEPSVAEPAEAPASPAPPRVKRVRIDLGPEDADVLAGFAAVTPYRSLHPAVTWMELPRLGRTLNSRDPLAEDHIRDGVLHLDLAPGAYVVGALFQEDGWHYGPYANIDNGLKVGDAWLVRAGPVEADAFFSDPRWVGNRRPSFAPGVTPWDRQIGPRTRWRTDTVVVGEGGLDLRIVGRDLSALVVEPGEDTAALEVELALVDAERERAWLARSGVWDQPVAAASEGLAGLEPLAWDAWPSPDGADPEVAVDLDLAPGERRALLFAVHGSDAPASVTVEGLDGLSVALHEVDWLDVRTSYRITRPTPHTVRPLDDDGTLRGGQGLVPLLAVELHLPHDAAEDSLGGAVVLTRGDTTLRLPVQVRARDLHLEDPPVPWGFWSDLRGPVAAFYGPDSEVARSRWASGVALMRRWGADRVSIRGAYFPAGRPRPQDAETMFSRIRWATETFRASDPRIGRFWEGPQVIPGDVQWHDPKFVLQDAASSEPTEPVYDEDELAFLEQMFEVASELQVSLYVSDEEISRGGFSFLPVLARRLAVMQSIAGDVGLNVASPHTGGWSIARRLADRVYLQTLPHIDHTDRRYFEGSDVEVWGYNYGWQREASGALAWLTEVEGLLIWHFNDATAAPFDETARRRKYNVVQPGEDPREAWPNRRLIRLGHGHFDQRYLGTLSSLVEELADRRRRRIRERVDHACELLRIAASGMEGRRFDDFDAEPLRDAASLQRLQDELGDAAEGLSGWSRRQRALSRGAAPERGAFFPERCELPRRPRVSSPHADPDTVPPLESD